MPLRQRFLVISAVMGWVFYTALIIFHLVNQQISLLLALGIWVLITHVTYGGYYVIKRLKSLTIGMIIWWFCTGMALVWLSWQTHLVLSSIAISVVFVLAVGFHTAVLKKSTDHHLQALARYKIRLELGGIGLGLINVLLATIWPSYITLWEALSLAIIIGWNVKILFYDKVYEGL